MSNSGGSAPAAGLQVDSQTADFKHFTTNDGLAANQTYYVLQSKQGFLWIATREGLSKFDGSEFTNYTHDPDNPASIASNYIWSMREAPDGALWLSLWGGGLDRFDPVSEAFTHYPSDENNPNSLSSPFVNSSFQDSKGNIWVATDKYLEKIDPKTKAITHYRPDPDKPDSLSAPVYIIQEDAKGTLWLGTYKGLDKFDPSTGNFTHYIHEEGNPNSLSGEYVWSLYIDKTGIIWVGAGDGGLNRFDPKTETFIHYKHHKDDPSSLSNDTITLITQDEQGTFWLGTLGGGLNRFDPKTGHFATFNYVKTDPNSLSNNTVWSLIEDDAGAYWIATESGFNYYDPRGYRFSLYRNDPNNNNSLSNNFIMSLYKDEQDILWIGTHDGGLNKLDRKSGNFTHYLHDSKDPNSLGHNSVNRIEPGPNGTLWLGTSNGLDLFDPASEQFTHYRHDPSNPNSLITNNIQGMVSDLDGGLWVASYNGGFSHFNPDTNTFTNYSHDNDNPDSLASNAVYDFLTASDGTLWIATHGGLNRFDPKKNKFQNFTTDNSHLSDLVVEDIYEDSRGTIWVSTNNGLNKYNPETKTFTTYFIKNGLPSNHISGVIEDNQGFLWIATYRGISKFNPETETFRNYDVRDGLQDNQFSQAIYKSKDGELFMGGANGFNSFYPDKLTNSTYIPKVVLTDIQVLNRPLKIGGDSPLKAHINIAKQITLPFDYTVLTLKFAALNFRSSQKNQYAYMLDGFDRDWVYTDSSRRFTTYTNLDSGSYTFRVKASNNDGVWNEQGTAFGITITPPWWATWWFRSTTVIAVLALVFFAHRSRIRSIEQRSLELEHQVSERTHELAESNQQLQIAKDGAEKARRIAEFANQAKSIFLANMSHELRTPLNAILGFSNVMLHDPSMPQAQQENLRIINNSGEHLLTLINDILDIAKIEAGQVKLENAPFDLGAMVRDVTDMMRIRADNKDLQLKVDQTSLFPRYIVGDEARLRQILVNLVGNAIKFTDQGGVVIRLGTTQDSTSRLLIEVEDSGRGIMPEEQKHIFDPFVQAGPQREDSKGTGLGLSITRQFVAMMGGHIGLDSVPGKGSLFRVELPLHRVTESDVIKPRQETKGQVAKLAPGQPDYRILIVEDQRDNQLLLTHLLESVGFQVRVAENGAEGVQLFQSWQPHFIWMDRRMPVMDGMEATRRIRELPGGKEVKIVAVTASAFSEQRNEILEGGMDDFLRKPYRAAEIYDYLAKYLGVTYLYNDEPKPQETSGGLTPEMLDALPQAMRSELIEALESLEIERIQSAIRNIATYDPELQSKLLPLTRSFDYSAILKTLRYKE